MPRHSQINYLGPQQMKIEWPDFRLVQYLNYQRPWQREQAAVLLGLLRYLDLFNIVAEYRLSHMKSNEKCQNVQPLIP
jgi:hypothetical protein